MKRTAKIITKTRKPPKKEEAKLLKHAEMKIITQIKDIQQNLYEARKSGKKIGFAPTMGALHDGHISLIQKSNKTADITICSIFVNPTQFNDPSDLKKYPIKVKEDINLLQKAGCDILFMPAVIEMYPQGTKNHNPRDFGFLCQTLEGEFRPGHFEGMVQVVERLLDIVQPDYLFMGQKDYQQQLIVGRLIKQMKSKTRLVVCPIKREKDGLAMSSRNMRLSQKNRGVAPEIYKVLRLAQKLFRQGKLRIGDIAERCSGQLKAVKGMELEYFEIRNSLTLQPARRRNEKLVALTAVRLGGIRLIDNILLN